MLATLLATLSFCTPFGCIPEQACLPLPNSKRCVYINWPTTPIIP